LHVIAADDRAATTDFYRTTRREPMNDGNHAHARASNAHARRIRETFCGPSRGAASAVTQTAARLNIDNGAARWPSLKTICRSNISSSRGANIIPIPAVLGQVVSMVQGLIGIASRVLWERMVFSDNGWTAGAGGYNADRHTGVICRVVPWQRARYGQRHYGGNSHVPIARRTRGIQWHNVAHSLRSKDDG
jgi:hypothetical protein